MATNEWGMLRDIIEEVAGAQKAAALRLSGTNDVDEAAIYCAVACALESIASKMRERGGMDMDEILANAKAIAKARRSTKDV